MAAKDTNEENNQSKGNSGEEDFGLPDINFDELEEIGDDEIPSETDGMQEEIDKARKLVEDSVEEPVATDAEEPKAAETGVFSETDPSSAISEGMDKDTMSELEEAGQLLFEATLLEEDIYKEESTKDESLADFEKPQVEASAREVEEVVSKKITSRDEGKSISDAAEEQIDEVGAMGALDIAEETPAETNSGLFSVDESLKTEEEVSFEQPEEPVGTVSEQSYGQYNNPADVKAKFAKIIGIGVVAVLVMAIAIWLFTGDKEEPKKKVASKEQSTKKKTTSTASAKSSSKGTSSEASSSEKVKPVSTTGSDDLKAKLKAKGIERSTSSPVATKTETTKPKAQTPKPKAQPVKSTSVSSSGEATTISYRTGRSFIIVASFTDERLANNYANSLANKGESVSVLLPVSEGFQNVRVAIADYGTTSAALNEIDGYKATYGDDIWILKH